MSTLHPSHPANFDLIAEFAFQADVCPRTSVKYRSHLEEFSRWLVHPESRRGEAATSLVEVAQADVQRFMSYLLIPKRFARTGRGRPVDVLSASARKSFLASLRGFYRYLVSVQLVDRDPTVGVARPKVKVRPGVHLSVEELRQLLDVPSSARDRFATYLLAFTAARLTEIRGLRWRDVDLIERTMMLHGKGDVYRMVDIHPQLMGELRRWLIRQLDQADRSPALARAKASAETDYVLMTGNGRPICQSTIYDQIKRRTFATLLLNSGQPLDAVADVLGHRSVDTTRKHYAFSSTARRRATIEAFDV